MESKIDKNEKDFNILVNGVIKMYREVSGLIMTDNQVDELSELITNKVSEVVKKHYTENIHKYFENQNK